jgi:hypothetical protein
MSEQSTKQSMLTTSDNPWNPFTHWDEWYAFDLAHGYDTCGLVARVVKSSTELSDEDQDEAIDLAFSEILTENLNSLYVIVYGD